jgi:hypothetical protein
MSFQRCCTLLLVLISPVFQTIPSRSQFAISLPVVLPGSYPFGPRNPAAPLTCTDSCVVLAGSSFFLL